MNKYGTLLIVDDNPTILTALKYALQETFTTIITLSRPEEILRTMAQTVVDAVLLDMNFTLGANTGQDGMLWLRAIKKHHPQTPVLLITAYADVGLAVKGLKNGAADFIVKPWDNDELTHRLKDALDKVDQVMSLNRVESAHIQRALDLCHGNLTKAAELLGISRQTLYNKIKK
jgi:DNA-binding NtrC family response regulator